MSVSQKVLVFFVFLFAILTFLSGVLDKKETFLVTTLTSSITATDLTLNVTADSTADWPNSGYIWIGDEYIRFQAKASDTFTVWQSGDETGRGYLYGTETTTAVFHATGSLVKAPEADILNTLLGYDTIVVTTNVGNIVGMGLLVWNFVKSLPRMVMWDYSFLEGDMVIVKYLLLYPVSIGFIVAFAMVFTQWARNLLRLI